MLRPIARTREEPIQAQLRRSIVEAIHSGQMAGGLKLPPSRQLAAQLGIARNTVTAVYEELVARGYLLSVPRQGHFVARALPPTAPPPAALPPAAASGAASGVGAPAPAPAGGAIAWEVRLKQRPSQLRHIIKPANWQDYPYPFVYGQVDPGLFPTNVWRACSRDALGRAAIDWWAADRAVEDDPQLVEQIRAQVLPQRGIFARPEEILITLGAQEGLYLASRLLVRPGTRVGIEAPGYPDARNVFATDGAEIHDLAVDAEGARLEAAAPLDLAVLTPAYHCPTMVTMTPARRAEVLARARRDDTLLIEDDYEGETAFSGDGVSLKSLDPEGRVIYLGTLSKVLAPGVRLGFMVADAALVAEARWLRRLIHRSAPLNNQRTAAIFLAEGHYLTLLRGFRSALSRRFHLATAGCDRHLPGFRRPASTGGSSIWLECPPGVDGRDLAARAAARGVLIESGDPFVTEAEAGRFLRLGISYIDEGRIDAGLQRLGEAAAAG